MMNRIESSFLVPGLRGQHAGSTQVVGETTEAGHSTGYA